MVKISNADHENSPQDVFFFFINAGRRARTTNLPPLPRRRPVISEETRKQKTGR
jgi:hypothetical protein